MDKKQLNEEYILSVFISPERRKELDSLSKE